MAWASFTDGGFLIGLILLGEYNSTVRSTLFIITLAEIKSDTKFRGIKKPIGRCIGEMKLRTFWAARPQSEYFVPMYRTRGQGTIQTRTGRAVSYRVQ